MLFICLILLNILNVKIDALKPIHLTIVACGDRLDEAVTALKSSLIFTPPPIVFHIFTEDHLRDEFRRQMTVEWPNEIQSKFQIEFYPIEFTRGNDQRWRELFKPCCTQRLFLPDILKDIDSVIYIDTDILFFSNVRHLWRYFRKFNSTQLAALSPEHEDPAMGWYNRFARHPYYGSLGLNSGVMLMNLTRMREVKMISKIIDIFDEYHSNITWGDQCLLNIYFHFYPEQMYEFSCEWNYRPDHCIYENNCAKARSDGIRIIHGCRRAFQNEKYPEFKAIYDRIHQWNFQNDLKNSLLKPIEQQFEQFSSTNCGKSARIFTKHLSKEISSLNYHSNKSLFHLAFLFNSNYQSVEQTSILLKSISLFSTNQTDQIHLHIIVSDRTLQNYLSQQIEMMNYSVTYYNSSINHPFQLFSLLNVDRVVYFNPNVILMNSIDNLWALFDQFKSKQFIGMFSQCHLAGSSSVLFLDINRMKNQNFDFGKNQQLTTEHVCFLSCEYFLDRDHCQSMAKIFFLSENIDRTFYGIFNKMLSQIDSNWNDEILSNEFQQIKTVNCRNELIDFLLLNKNKLKS